MKNQDKDRTMYEDEGLELLMLGYLVNDDGLWNPNEREREPEEPEELEELPKKRRWWVRPWIGVKDNEECNTMYKLLLEVSQVGRLEAWKHAATIQKTYIKSCVKIM